ncbi:MAG: SDR family NAD(P)-dependent oxidoreductase [Actinobacteria bacterium]|nr:SDR family NAD(P)-dependent oxidoreductase [Actinomycetota bacterium]
MRGFVLITGARSGIGRATALHLDSLGFAVIATDLPGADAEGLAREASGRLASVDLDVTDADSIAAAAERAAEISAGAGLAGLVNNAGIAIGGPLEHLPLEDFRHQLEVNLVGPLAVSQAMLPLLRDGRGRVVNITSLAGRVGAPFLGAYAASKHGLEGLSASLRAELRPWGIQVSAVEPGLLRSSIYETSLGRFRSLRGRLPEHAERDYGEVFGAQEPGMDRLQRLALSPDRAAKAVAKALTAKRPRARYLVGPDARMSIALHTLAGPRAQERTTMAIMGSPRRWRRGGPPPPG